MEHKIMAQEEFTLTAESVENGAKSKDTSPEKQPCGTICPLANIPAETWARFLRLPFRKRHPFIFWLLVALVILVIAGIVIAWDRDEAILEKENCIALVTVSGPIMDPAPTLAWIAKIENSPGVKGVLLRVDSPGGGAAASQEIYAALARLGKKIPIVASMGSMAASGGLMVSMAAQRIFANPSTVTGSIGVRMDIPQLQGLMGKIGVGQETLVTAPFKNAASYMHPLSSEDKAYLENVLMNMHDQFVGIVARGRNMPLEKARELASGKIFTGQQAIGLGLVDTLGGQYDALAWLATKTGVPARNKLLKKRPKNKSILEAVLETESLANWFAAVLGRLDSASRQMAQPVFLYQF